MATLDRKGDSWYCQFMFRRQRHNFSIGKVTEVEAGKVVAKVDYLLMRIRQNLITVPAGMDIISFIQNDGNSPNPARQNLKPEITLTEFREAYFGTVSGGSVEANTLYTAGIHFRHLEGTFGPSFIMNGLALVDLQRHINRRQKAVSATTIKKEIDTLRAAWNWAMHMSLVEAPFPTKGMTYAKTQDKLPFMTWTEIERRIAAGGDADELWECLYLTEAQMTEFLDFAQTRKAPPWVYPMCVMAAHAGPRRSEMLRAEPQDVDYDAGIITLREKKRVRGKVTTRRVPVSSRLQDALQGMPSMGARLFGKRSANSAQKAFMRLVGKHPSSAANAKTKARKLAKRKTKWSVLRGWHVLRHSFISALAAKGVDQRVINELAGHSSEAMARRYRHLIPELKQNAIKQVFG